MCNVFYQYLLIYTDFYRKFADNISNIYNCEVSVTFISLFLSNDKKQYKLFSINTY